MPCKLICVYAKIGTNKTIAHSFQMISESWVTSYLWRWLKVTITLFFLMYHWWLNGYKNLCQTDGVFTNSMTVDLCANRTRQYLVNQSSLLSASFL